MTFLGKGTPEASGMSGPDPAILAVSFGFAFGGSPVADPALGARLAAPEFPLGLALLSTDGCTSSTSSAPPASAHARI